MVTRDILAKLERCFGRGDQQSNVLREEIEAMHRGEQFERLAISQQRQRQSPLT